MQMQSNRIRIQYQLTLKAPLHCGTGLNNGLTDRGMARDHERHAYIPGSTIKGVLRHHATRLAHMLDLEANLPHTDNLQPFAQENFRDIPALIFGSQYRPGTLYFDDALLCHEDRIFFEEGGSNDWLARQAVIRTRVGLSRVTNTVRTHQLFSTEYGIPGLRFDGVVSGYLQGIAPAKAGDYPPDYTFSLLLLVAAFSSLDGIGGEKSVGAGHIDCNIGSVQIDGESACPRDIIAASVAWTDYETIVELLQENDA